MNRSQIKDFTKGGIMGQLVLFSFPLFLYNLLRIVYNIVDMIVVGKVLGLEGISGVSVGGDVTALLNFSAIGFTPFWIGLVFYLTGTWKKKKEL